MPRPTSARTTAPRRWPANWPTPPRVYDNQFRFNQSFSQAKTVQGGGLAVMGVPDPVADNGLSSGSGNVVVANNTFQGNLAGAGDGGGIALVGVNGTETGSSLASWFRVDIVNNVIVNNGAGKAGGGISLLDSSNVRIVNNTVSLNDSYATAARAFAIGDPTQAANTSAIATSDLQNGAGIAAYPHSTPFQARVAPLVLQGLPTAHAVHSNPTVQDSVVIGNRRYQWRVNYGLPQDQAACQYDATGVNPCFGLGHIVAGTLVAGPAPQGEQGNDIAVLGPTVLGVPLYRLKPDLFRVHEPAPGRRHAGPHQPRRHTGQRLRQLVLERAERRAQEHRLLRRAVGGEGCTGGRSPGAHRRDHGSGLRRRRQLHRRAFRPADPRHLQPVGEFHEPELHDGVDRLRHLQARGLGDQPAGRLLPGPGLRCQPVGLPSRRCCSATATACRAWAATGSAARWRSNREAEESP